MISIPLNRLHCHCWGGGSLISVMRHLQRRVKANMAKVRGVL